MIGLGNSVIASRIKEVATGGCGSTNTSIGQYLELDQLQSSSLFTVRRYC